VASHPNADPGPSGDLVGTAPAARLLVVSRFSVTGAGARAEFVSSAESASSSLPQAARTRALMAMTGMIRRRAGERRMMFSFRLLFTQP